MITTHEVDAVMKKLRKSLCSKLEMYSKRSYVMCSTKIYKKIEKNLGYLNFSVTASKYYKPKA